MNIFHIHLKKPIFIMTSIFVCFRLPVSADQRAFQEAGVRGDRPHHHEPAGGLQELPVHAAADQGSRRPHGGQENIHQLPKEQIQ